MRAFKLATVAAAVLLAGCSMMPKYERPDAPIATKTDAAVGSQVRSADSARAASVRRVTPEAPDHWGRLVPKC